MGRWAVTALLLTLLAACEGRARTRNSVGGELSQSASGVQVGNIYRFVNVEQSLGDARRAVQGERWADAVAATEALLKQQPGHLEAKRIGEQARLELASQAHFDAFTRASAAKDTLTLATYFRALPEASVYRERARPEYERVREQWVALRENDARTLAHAGRCRDAHRVARLANDHFPEVRARLDLAADSCHPATGQELEPDPPSAASPPVASLSPAGPPAAAASEPPPVVVAPPRPPPAAPAPVRPPTPAPAPAPAPARPAGPRPVAAGELEKLRVAGKMPPALPEGVDDRAHRDNLERVVLGLTLCLSEAGDPMKVDLTEASGYAEADASILREVRAWRFRPYLVDGRAVPVCTRLRFVYQLE